MKWLPLVIFSYSYYFQISKAFIKADKSELRVSVHIPEYTKVKVIIDTDTGLFRPMTET